MTTKRIKDLATVKYTGYLALDDEDGTGKFLIDTLIESIAPLFDPTRDSEHAYGVNDMVMYHGALYRFKAPHYGEWDEGDVSLIPMSTIISALLEVIAEPVDLNSPSTWVQGGVNPDTGALAPSMDQRITTNLLELTDDSVVKATLVSGVTVQRWNAYCYAEDGSYVGYRTQDQVTGGKVSTIFDALPTAKLIRIGFKDISGQSGDVSPENIANIAVFDNTANVYRYATKKNLEDVASALSASISSIEQEMSDRLDGKYNLNQPSKWLLKGVDGSGNLFNDDDRLTTAKLELLSNAVITVTLKNGISASNANVYCYEADGSYLGVKVVGFGQQTTVSTSYASVLADYPTTKTVRIGLVNVSGATVSPANITNIAEFADTLYTDKYATKEEVDDDMAAMKEYVDEAVAGGGGGGSVTEVVDLNQPSKWVAGYVNTSNGSVIDSSTALCTVLLELTSNSVFTVTKKSGVNWSTKNLYCYTEDGTYLGYLNEATSIATALLTYPTAAKYRFDMRSITGATVSPANITNIAEFADTLYTDKYATKEYVDEAVAGAGVLPSGGNVGDVLTKTANGSEWAAPSGGGGGALANLDLNDTSLWDTLTVNGNNGTYYNSGENGKRLATKNTFEIDPNATTWSFTIGSGVSIFGSAPVFYAYAEDNSFVGGLQYVSDMATWVAQNPTAKKFRIALININGATCNAANLANIITFNQPAKVPSDYATEAYVDEAVSQGVAQVQSSVTDIENKLTTSYDLSNPDYWLSGGIGTHDGVLTPNSTRLSTKLLDLHSDAIVKSTAVSGVTTSNMNIYCYAADGSYIDNALILTVGNTRTFAQILAANPTTKFIRIGLVNISGITASPENIASIATFDKTLYTDNFVTLKEFESGSGSGGGSGSSQLKGKKWYACGDSFTAGVVDPFEDGKYQGQNKSYPLYVGLRNDMEVVNFAVSGSTIGYNSSSTDSNCFTYPTTGRLYQIPQDVDYITLKFGINDGPGHKNIPLGTISDTTIDTEYGAWNVVLEYLITNYPFAKIGVIVSNGCDNTDYPQAAKDCAEKWGVPVLDENFDYNVPLLHRVNGKPNVAQAAHDLRLQQFRVSADNTHPNAQAMEYESTFVENFLCSL